MFHNSNYSFWIVQSGFMIFQSSRFFSKDTITWSQIKELSIGQSAVLVECFIAPSFVKVDQIYLLRRHELFWFSKSARCGHLKIEIINDMDILKNYSHTIQNIVIHLINCKNKFLYLYWWMDYNGGYFLESFLHPLFNQ